MHRSFDLRKGPANTLTPLPLSVNYVVLTQTDKHKARKTVATKRSIIFWKNESEVLKPSIQNFLQKNICFLYKMPTLWGSEVDNTILEQLKVKIRLQLLQRFKKQKL